MAEKNMKAKISVDFEESASRQQLNSGEDITTLFGKVRKFFSDLKAVAFSGAYSDLSGTPDLSRYASKSKYGDTTINVGRKADTTVGEYSTAEGSGTTASGNFSHTEGSGTTASGNGSHSEGGNSIASGSFSHAEGADTTASNYSSHAGGSVSEASGRYSFSHGNRTQALHESEVAFGQNNISNDDTLFSIGDGAYNARHNAFEITTTGGKLHDKNIITSGQCIQFVPYNMLYFALNDRLLLFSNNDAVTRGIYFINDTPNDIVVCALISATGSGPIVQYGYGSNTYPEIQNTGEQREWFSAESITTYPTIYTMTVPSGKLGYYGVYNTTESTYATIHDIRCPYFNYF